MAGNPQHHLVAVKIKMGRAPALDALAQVKRIGLNFHTPLIDKAASLACAYRHTSPDFPLCFESFSSIMGGRLEMICHADNHLMAGEVKCGCAGGQVGQLLGF